MNIEWLSHYDWLALLIFFGVLIPTTMISKRLLFKLPALKAMVDLNKEHDRPKLAKDKYPPMIKSSQKAGLYTNVFFIFLVFPFLLTTQSQPIWKGLIDIVLILFIYDFFYYLMHRFLFHGKGYFRRVHGIHHQARNPSRVDALYVHPVETFMGVALFGLTITGVSLLTGQIHAIALAITYVIYTQQNIVNHVQFTVDKFPYKTVNYLTTKHAIHHENMHKGNYASLSPLFDFMFGTLD